MLHLTTNTKHANMPPAVQPLTWRITMKSVAAIDRELKALDSLEKRVKQTVNPSQVLLREIQKKRDELLNPKETPDAKTSRT